MMKPIYEQYRTNFLHLHIFVTNKEIREMKKKVILWCLSGILGVFWVIVIAIIIVVYTMVSSISESLKGSSFYDEMCDKAVEDGEKLVNQYGEEFKRKLYEYYGKEIQIESLENVMYRFY